MSPVGQFSSICIVVLGMSGVADWALSSVGVPSSVGAYCSAWFFSSVGTSLFVWALASLVGMVSFLKIDFLVHSLWLLLMLMVLFMLL